MIEEEAVATKSLYGEVLISGVSIGAKEMCQVYDFYSQHANQLLSPTRFSFLGPKNGSVSNKNITESYGKRYLSLSWLNAVIFLKDIFRTACYRSLKRVE